MQDDAQAANVQRIKVLHVESSKIILFMMFISSMDLLDHVTNEALDMRDFPMITK